MIVVGYLKLEHRMYSWPCGCRLERRDSGEVRRMDCDQHGLRFLQDQQDRAFQGQIDDYARDEEMERRRREEGR